MSIPRSAWHEEARTPSRPIHALTGLRFAAALLVFLHHAAGPRYYEGFSGVTFFYVLSGFILTYNYHRTFTSLRPGELWSFYGSRLARIYPVAPSHLSGHHATVLVSFRAASKPDC
jgi:peptidoglycan/LPS O-acetylase OafA/YrhL